VNMRCVAGTKRITGVRCAAEGCANNRRNAAGYCAKHEPPAYVSWRVMRERCNNPKCPAYPRYGGRGLTVDPRWDDFAAFLSDMGPREAGFVLHRIDNDSGYCKDNCEWVSRARHALIHNSIGVLA
jgi:hypothetical protein